MHGQSSTPTEQCPLGLPFLPAEILSVQPAALSHLKMKPPLPARGGRLEKSKQTECSLTSLNSLSHPGSFSVLFGQVEKRNRAHLEQSSLTLFGVVGREVKVPFYLS